MGGDSAVTTEISYFEEGIVLRNQAMLPLARKLRRQIAAQGGRNFVFSPDYSLIFYKNDGTWYRQEVYGNPEPGKVGLPEDIGRLDGIIAARRMRVLTIGIAATAAAMVVTAASVFFYSETKEESNSWNSNQALPALPSPSGNGFPLGGYDPVTGQYRSGASFGGVVNPDPLIKTGGLQKTR